VDAAQAKWAKEVRARATPEYAFPLTPQSSEFRSEKGITRYSRKPNPER